MWGGVDWRCAGFCAPRICGRNQVDQNSVYGDIKRVLNSIGGSVNCTYVWCWRTLEQANKIVVFYVPHLLLFVIYTTGMPQLKSR